MSFPFMWYQNCTQVALPASIRLLARTADSPALCGTDASKNIYFPDNKSVATKREFTFDSKYCKQYTIILKKIITKI